ncbi:MAG: PKD domain-containing protein [Haloferula sp.]
MRRYRFDSGSPPAAAFTSSSSAGEAPALVSFTDATVEGTYSIASWSWDFGDGTASSLQSPSHTFDEPGVYSVELVVTDSVGLTSVASEQVIITDTTTVTLDLELFDGRAHPEIPLATPTGLAFFQRDGITPLAFVGGSGAAGNQWLVPAGGGLNQVFDLPLTGNGFVVVVGDSDMHGFQARTMALDVEPGESITVPGAICLSDTAIAGRITSVSGEPAQVDLGVWHAGSAFEVACGRDYLPDAIYPSTGVNHRVETDGEGYYYIALPNSADGMSFELDVVGDVQRDRFVAAEVNATASAGSSVVIDIEVAEWRRGGGDDLSGIPMTPAVDFADVQAIFSANCTGCHRANTSNNGGLDLTEGNSLGELLGQPSLFVDGLLLVDPGSPERSYLFEKINSANPQQGARMRPSDAMPLADQALIRDWIAQLSPSYESFLLSSYGVGAGDEGAGLLEDFDGDGVINGQSYSQLRVAQSAVAGGEWQVEFELLPTLSGLTVLVEVSDDLADQSWRAVAVRPRGSSSWTTGAGISVSESPPGRVVLSDEAISSRDRRFYRMTLREF